MIIITLPSKYVIQTFATENPYYNAGLDKYTSNVIKSGVIPKRKNGIMTVELVDDIEDEFDIELLQVVMQIPEATVEGFQSMSYFKISDLSAEVPAYLPKAMTIPIQDEEGEIIEPARLKKWSEWIGSNYTIREIEGYNYFLNYAGTGEALDASIILQLFNDGIELIENLPDQDQVE